MGNRKKVAETSHVMVQRCALYNEYRVVYKGLHADRAEAMAYYCDDFDDAEGTMVTMQQDRKLAVFCADIKDREIWSDYYTPAKLG